MVLTDADLPTGSLLPPRRRHLASAGVWVVRRADAPTPCARC
jgi:hypothetical protein